MAEKITKLATLVQLDQPTVTQGLDTYLTVGLFRKSPETVKWYEKRLRSLIAYLGEGVSLVAVMEADLLDWVASLEQKSTRWGGASTHPESSGGLSPHTIRGHVRAAKTFFGWLKERGVIEANPAELIPLTKVPKTARKGIADPDVRKMLEAARGDVRDYAILRFVEAS